MDALFQQIKRKQDNLNRLNELHKEISCCEIDDKLKGIDNDIRKCKIQLYDELNNTESKDVKICKIKSLQKTFEIEENHVKEIENELYVLLNHRIRRPYILSEIKQEVIKLTAEIKNEKKELEKLQVAEFDHLVQLHMEFKD